MVPFGRGGAGFSVLDVTDDKKPYHLYTIFNDDVNNQILRTDHNDNQFTYPYIDETYSFMDFDETRIVSENYANDNGVDKTCNSSLTTACYESNTWTLPSGLMGIQKSDLRVKIDNVEQNIFSVNLVGGDTKITFNRSIHFNGDTSGAPGSRPNDTILEIGPGTGNLTSFILKKKPKKIFVIEKDNELSVKLKNKFNIIGDVRGGQGLMAAIEVVSDQKKKTAMSMDEMKKLHQSTYEAGAMVRLGLNLSLIHI